MQSPDWPVHVWDNASEDSPEMHDLASRWDEVHWQFSPENIGFAAAVNRLAAVTTGDFLLLNPDAELTASPKPLVEALERCPRTAAIGPFVEVEDLRPWDNARRLPGPVRMSIEYMGMSRTLSATPLSQRYSRPPREPGYVSGACLLIRRRAWEHVGPFDEQFWLYSEEVDWAKRTSRLGWRVALYPDVLARHVGGASADLATRSNSWLLQMQLAYLEKHHGRAAAHFYRCVVRGFDRLRHARSRRRAGR